MKDEEIKILKDFIYNDDTEYCWDWHSFDYKTIFPIIIQLLNEYEKQNKKMFKLKDNWNKLKKYIQDICCYDEVGLRIIDPSYLEDKIAELERGVSNE